MKEKKLRNIFKEKKLWDTFKEYPILVLILILELSVIVYINLFKLEYYLGYDSAITYLGAIEMWKQKQLFLDNWAYTTGVAGIRVFIVALLYGLTGDIFFSYGVITLCLVLFLLTIVNSLLDRFECKLKGKLWFFVLLLAPYTNHVELINNLDYFSMMFSSLAAYLFTVVIGMLFCLVFWDIDTGRMTRKTKTLTVIVVVCLVVHSITIGMYMLVATIVPVICYWGIRRVCTEEWKEKRYKSCIFLIVCVAACFVGVIIQRTVVDFESREAGITWITVGNFLKNLQSIFLGYLSLTGALPLDSNLQILTPRGIGFVFRFIISIAIIGGSLFTIWKQIKGEKNWFAIFMAVVMSFNIAILSLMQTGYGQAVFETRYLILAFIPCLMLCAKCFDGTYTLFNRTTDCLINFILIASLLAGTCSSYAMMEDSQSDYDMMMEIVETAGQFDTQVVYVIGDVHCEVVSRSLKVLDTSKIYKYVPDLTSRSYWGDYIYYDDASEYRGMTVLVAKESDYGQLAEHYRNAYEFVADISDSDFNIYVSQSNPVDLRTGLPESGYSVDYPYTKGMYRTEAGVLTAEGVVETTGVEGFAVFGPYDVIDEAGTYDFILHYTADMNQGNRNQIGFFDIAINQEQLTLKHFDASENTVTISGVEFGEDLIGSQLEYRVYALSGAKFQIEYIEIIRVD